MYDNNNVNLQFYSGFDILINMKEMNYVYGSDIFGPEVEKRSLDSIRMSLLDKNCKGPNVVYKIAMDVGKLKDKDDLINRNLLYGTVIYSTGALGIEPIRSQGHIHAVSKSCGLSTPEVYEIWNGKAYIYMQENAKDNCGKCYAIEGNPGDVIIVPPGWAHSTISADTNIPLVFGAWCVRDYGFDYKDVREHNGLAYYPIVKDNKIEWLKNPLYNSSDLIVKKPRKYIEFKIDDSIPIYTQYEMDNERFTFVTKPQSAKDIWVNFIP